MTQRSSILKRGGGGGGQQQQKTTLKAAQPRPTSSLQSSGSAVNTHMVPDVVGTMGMSSASVGMDQGIWNCGASSRITMFLRGAAQSVSRRQTQTLQGRLTADRNTLPKDLGAVIVVLHRVLHKAEAVDVADVRVPVGPEKVEPTDSLLRREQKLRACR